MTADWDARYASADLPWDTGEPDPHLVDCVESGRIQPGRALEVGCGTGTNAIWLAARGFEVHGVDISPRAIELARAKAEAAGSQARFSALDFLAEPAPEGPFDFILDRGVFHVFDEVEVRAHFAARVAGLLGPKGRWLSLLGSTEGPERDHGPPRRSARDIVGAVEPVLEIVSLSSTQFDANIPTPARAWLLLARPREVPAQPSTRREA